MKTNDNSPLQNHREVRAVQAVIVRPDDESFRTLILRRFNPTTNRDEHRLVKGSIKPKEGFWEAIRREIQEETGIAAVALIHQLKSYYYSYELRADTLVKNHVTTFLVRALAETDDQLLAPLEEGDYIIKANIWTDLKTAKKLSDYREERQLLQQAIDHLQA